MKYCDNNEWNKICEAFCDKYGLTLLYCKEWELGAETQDGVLGKYSIERMREILEGE